VNEQQRYGILGGTPLVYIIQFAEPVHRDGAREHGKRVQLALVRAPVIPVFPPAGEPLDVGERRAVSLLGGTDLDRQANVVKLALK